MCKTFNNIILRHGKLQVSSNHRFLVHEDGTPFFWVGDTAWELFHRLNREEATFYLETRARQGFNVIQATVLAELDGLREGNAYGEVPLQELNPELPNERYFEHVDWIIKEAEKHGIYIALLPTWGDKVNLRYDWAKGPEIFEVQNAFVYAKWLAQRYCCQNNIVWVLGGDRNPDEKAIPIWKSMAQGIKEILADALITFHPQPFNGSSSSTWFHKDEWLSFNMLQTGHDKFTPVYETINKDYELSPIKPVLNGEPTYEAHGLSFKPFENGYASDVEVRKYAYWCIFSGACGHTYGCHSVWQFYSSKRVPINFPIYEWKEALNLAGANQMKYLKKLLVDRSLLLCIPGNDILVNHDNSDVENYIIALRASDGGFALVYSTTGKAFGINLNKFKGTELIYNWFNPKNGTTILLKDVKRESQTLFTPPNNGYGNDWVLIIDGPSKNAEYAST
jgi:hypothetical protein